MNELKNTLRQEGIKQRKAMNDSQRQLANHKICQKVLEIAEKRGCKTVFSYLAFNGEVDLAEFHRIATKELGITIVYPFCQQDNDMIACKVADNSFVKGKFGILTPDYPNNAVEIPKEEIDMVLMPCTRFDINKNRIGMGKGFYDKYLTNLPKIHKVIIAFENQKAESVSSESWDVKGDNVVTNFSIY